MAITTLSAYPSRSMSPQQFSAAMDVSFSELPVAFTEANAMFSAMGMIAAGTAFAIPYTFDTTTSDADPTTGKLRLNQATQNTASVIRADLLGSNSQDYTAVLGDFTSSTSAVKGQIKLVKLSDATKWLSFNVTAMASPTGYKNITVTSMGSSAASPFVNGDSIVMLFTRSGDAGVIPYMHVRDQQASGTNGGTSLANDYTQTRVINMTISNTCGGSLNANQVSLPAGTYSFFGRAPSQNPGRVQAALYNVSDSAYTLVGASDTVNTGSAHSIVSGIFTIAATKSFTLRHFTFAALVTTGLGAPATSGQVEVFSEMIFQKIG